MSTFELWHWWITDPYSGQRLMSPQAMTEGDAMKLDSTARRVYGTLEVKACAGAQAIARSAGWRSAARDHSVSE